MIYAGNDALSWHVHAKYNVAISSMWIAKGKMKGVTFSNFALSPADVRGNGNIQVPKYPFN